MEMLEEFITSGTNQARLLATLWRDEKFFSAAERAGLRSDDFALPACELIHEVLVEYYEKYGKMPSMATLQDCIADKMKETGDTSDTATREVCWALGAMSGDTILDYSYACNKLIDFIRSSRLSKASMNPSDTNKILEVAKEVESLSIGDVKKRQVSLLEDYMDILPHTSDDVDVKIPTGISALDFVTNGGLNVTLNEVGIGMAGTGVGKTNMMINFAVSAAFAGYRVLFITLELTEKEIMRRALGIMAHVKTAEMKLPTEKWSDASRERLEYLTRSRIRNYIKIADLSDGDHTVSDLNTEIEAWKKEVRAIDGDDSRCKLVIVDWLDMLTPEHSEMRMLTQPWQALERIGKRIKQLVNRQNVSMWAVTQTNRQGSGVQKVRLDHVSGAYAKLFFGAVVIGLAPTDEDDSTMQINSNLSNSDMKRLKTECDRTLHMSILKNRDGVMREFDIYQGPTLRFWKSKSEWRTVEKMLEGNDMKKIFGDGIE